MNTYGIICSNTMDLVSTENFLIHICLRSFPFLLLSDSKPEDEENKEALATIIENIGPTL